ncbi:ABC transporter ATP-binding protein [Geopsychrobacter electrodiphilus]|uniref:ABC transporter ATP-binding protein n=1 Tax=Geopsychrobacter electrodiphilus TaxID=225196 RepID=UPI00035E532D|nr:ABC transporter ATP-binding protein [Geopsychrobacter electrodiphilus]
MLKLNHLTMRFGGLTALKDVSLHIGQNEIVGLVGPNGAGKTTLFNVISGLAKPSSGQVIFDSKNVLKSPLYAKARMGIGRTFQIPQPMHELTVRENLIVAQRFGTGRVNLEKINEILDFLNLSAKAEVDAASELSLTELKALEVGKAMATNPKILLLDEVLAGLETHGKREFLKTLQKLHDKYQISIFMIEHDIETVSNFSQRICVLNFGQIIADGPPSEVFNDPTVIECYTGGDHA